MIKKMILISLLCFSYFNANAGTEYIGASIDVNLPIYGFNNGPNEQYFITQGAATNLRVYDGSGILIQSLIGTNLYGNRSIVYKGKDYIIYRGTNYVNPGPSDLYQTFIIGKNNAENLGTSPIIINNGYIYKYGTSTGSYYYNTTSKAWTLTGFLNIPQNSYHSFTYSNYTIPYIIVYSNGGQNIYFNGTKYFLEGIDENGYYNFEIFTNNILGTTLEKLNLDTTFKNNVVNSKFYFFVDPNSGQANYYLSNCYSTGKVYTTPEGSFTGQNLTFRGYINVGDSFPTGFNFIDDKYYKNVYNGNWLKQLSYSGFTNYGYECNPTITFGGFNGNIPTYMQYIRGSNIYKYVFDASQIALFTGNTTIGGSSSVATQFSTGGTLTDNQVTEDLFDFDINGDGEVSVWEYTLAPFTFIKNVVVQLNESLKNIWDFLKAILNIGNISIIQHVHADNILQNIADRTGDFTNGNIEESATFYNIFNIIKYGTFFGLFFMILVIFIYLKFK